MSARFFINSRVYEVMGRNDYTNLSALNKQVNNQMIVTHFNSGFASDISFNEIMEQMKPILVDMVEKSGNSQVLPCTEENTQVHQLYPLRHDNLDKKFNMHYYYGLVEDTVRNPTDQPFTCKPDATQEEIDAAHAENCAPRTVFRPFVMIVPVVSNLMWDIRISHCPDNAIVLHDPEDENIPSIEIPEFLADAINSGELDKEEGFKQSVAFTYMSHCEQTHSELPIEPYVKVGKFKDAQEFQTYLANISVESHDAGGLEDDDISVDIVEEKPIDQGPWVNVDVEVLPDDEEDTKK